MKACVCVSGSTGVSSARGKEMTPLEDREPIFHAFLRKALFYLTARNPSIIQLERICRYMDCLQPSVMD